MWKTLLATLVFGLALSLPALAKDPSKPVLPELTANKTSPTEKIISGQGANRFIEMLIELAWLADPVTFPYYLEARVEGSALQVKGFVPGTAVRDQALKVARLQCPMTVTDNMNIRQGIAVQPTRIPPGQLEKASLACLRVSFPRADSLFRIQADNAGRIKVMGQVHSFDEKLAVSQGLRRLHGCTAVINQVHVVEGCQPAANNLAFIPKPDMEANSAMGPAKHDKPKPSAIVKSPEPASSAKGPAKSDKPRSTPIVISPEPAKPSRPFLERLGFAGKNPNNPSSLGVVGFKSKPVASMTSGSQVGSAPQPASTSKKETGAHSPPRTAEKSEVQNVEAVSAKAEAPQPSGPPLVTHGTVMVMDEPGPANPVAQLRKHIVASCGIPEQNLLVQFKSAAELEIRIQAKNQDEANTLAQRVFQLPELLPYQVDVRVTIPR